jgi:diguanylate cyclase (GGDEF)-like protein
VVATAAVVAAVVILRHRGRSRTPWPAAGLVLAAALGLLAAAQLCTTAAASTSMAAFIGEAVTTAVLAGTLGGLAPPRRAAITGGLTIAVVTVGAAMLIWALSATVAGAAGTGLERGTPGRVVVAAVTVAALTAYVQFREHGAERLPVFWFGLIGLLLLFGHALTEVACPPGSAVFQPPVTWPLLPLILCILMASQPLRSAAVTCPGGSGTGAPGSGAVGQQAPDGAADQLTRSRIGLLFLVVVIPAALQLLLPPADRGAEPLWGLLFLALLVLVFAYLIRSLRSVDRSEYASRVASLRDGLTGLGNRAGFLDALDRCLSSTAGTGRAGLATVLLLDGDRFKTINDTWGHATGDVVLAALGDRLRHVIRAEDLLARVGGDEFAILAEHPDAAAAAALAERVRVAFSAPVAVKDGVETILTCSVGFAQTPYTDPVSASDLIQRAALAVSAAKEAGRDTTSAFDEQLRSRVEGRALVAHDLRGAVARGEISVHYQPIVVPPTPGLPAQLVAVEALARWNHPTRGLVSPVTFIEVAEELGLIAEIGRFVLDTATEQVAQWQQLPGFEQLAVSVNVSPVQLLRADVAGEVAHALGRSGLSPSSLWVEITESVTLESSDRVRAVLAAVRDQGVALAVDDFGTGYAAFAHLKEFSVNIVKIDRCFAEGVDTDRSNAAIVSAVCGMAHALGMSVIAEGAETAEQARQLVALGADLLQGYRFGRPQPGGPTPPTVTAGAPSTPTAGALPS